jgi:hypothetical protein
MMIFSPGSMFLATRLIYSHLKEIYRNRTAICDMGAYDPGLIGGGPVRCLLPILGNQEEARDLIYAGASERQPPL